MISHTAAIGASSPQTHVRTRSPGFVFQPTHPTLLSPKLAWAFRPALPLGASGHELGARSQLPELALWASLGPQVR